MIPSLAITYLAFVLVGLWLTRPRSRFTLHVAHAPRGTEIDSAALIQVLSRKRAVNDGGQS